MKPIDDQKLLQLMNRIRRWFSIRNLPGGEDAAQAYVVYIYEGYGKKQTVAQYCINYLRNTSGRSDAPNYAHRVQLNTVMCDRSNETNLKHDPVLSINDRFALLEFISKVANPRARDMFLLRLEGYSLPEIGERYGITGSAVSMLCARAIQVTHKRNRRRCKAIRDFLSEAQ